MTRRPVERNFVSPMDPYMGHRGDVDPLPGVSVLIAVFVVVLGVLGVLALGFVGLFATQLDIPPRMATYLTLVVWGFWSLIALPRIFRLAFPSVNGKKPRGDDSRGGDRGET